MKQTSSDGNVLDQVKNFLEMKPVTEPIDYWNITKVKGYYEFYIPAFDHTFNNITTLWNPRLNKTEQHVALIVLVSMAIVIWIYGMARLCRSNWKLLLAAAKLTWDAIDVVLDAWVFFDLERGYAIDYRITRDLMVNNAMLAFACLGCLKMLITIHLLHYAADEDSELSFSTAQEINHFIVYAFEDCAESFLEYFWIEKYFILHPPLYMLVRDALVCIYALYIILPALWNACRGFRLLFLSSCVIGVCHALRVKSAMYQYATGRLWPGCLKVMDGKLIQTPFNDDCLREVDYAILICLWLPFILFAGFACCKTSYGK